MVPIYGFEKTSLLDYPDKISSIIFTYGCNLKCPYCHNPELVVDGLNSKKVLSQKYILDFLKTRVGKIDAVVITGGEPLIHEGLINLIKKIKKLGYLIKLDTNGLLPSRLQSIIDTGMIDYIAMDIKYPKSEYPKSESKVQKSIEIIMNSGIDYEFRTTYVKGIHNYTSVEKICEMIQGSKRYYIQNFRAGKSIDKSLDEDNSFSQKELKEIKKIAKRYIKKVYIR